MKPVLTVLVGLPGSGKSTYAAELSKKKNTVVVSADSIKENVFGNRNYSDTFKVIKHATKQIKSELLSGNNVVYDSTNVGYGQRMNLLNNLKGVRCIKRCVCILAPFEDCIERIEINEQAVSYESMKNLYMSWNTPYWFEGWDNIELYYTKPVYREVEQFLLQRMSYNQGNPHHSRSLGSHCKHAGDRLNGSLQYAGWLHDIGKPFTRTDTNSVAHYYQHENCGAYDCLFFSFPKMVHALDVSIVVNLHMIPYVWSGKEQKYLDLWGLRLYKKVVKLHKADELSK